MTSFRLGFEQQRRALTAGWQDFWFRREPAHTLGLVRIAFGALAVFWTLSLLPDLYDFFGSQGVVRQPSTALWGGFFNPSTTDQALLIGWIILLVSSIALMVGWHSRIAAILVYVLILSFERRNPFIFNGGDTLIRIEALFLALSSCGAALSLDQRRRTGSFWSAQNKKIWPLRLMQIQVSIIYLSTVLFKLQGDTWPNGTAVSYALRIQDMLLRPTPDWVVGNPWLVNLATWATLMVELAIGVLVWNRRWRPWVLAAGVVLHLSIMFSIGVGFFTPATLLLYLAFIPPEKVKALPDTVKDWFTILAARVQRRSITAEMAEEASEKEPDIEAERSTAPTSPKIESTTPEHAETAPHFDDEDFGVSDTQVPLINNAYVHTKPPEPTSRSVKESSDVWIRN